MGLPRTQAQLLDGLEVTGGDAEQCRALLAREVEQGRAIFLHRKAVMEQDRRATGESRDQPVPHHPSRGRRVKNAVARTHVALQLVFLEIL